MGVFLIRVLFLFLSEWVPDRYGGCHGQEGCGRPMVVLEASLGHSWKSKENFNNL